MAKDSKESSIAEQCLCNAGIASGNAQMETKQQMVSTFYKTQGFNFFKQQADSEDDEDEASEEDAL